ncbi:hypothetical protein A2U01_0010834 [Trifolium medium]|uniref:Uncharacterized protein n=1 Tax=Trifolium medium TaxID=97028 RepID=A0A392MQX0_9FABA|nr:hypothetical protein [Trifolium medium]
MQTVASSSKHVIEDNPFEPIAASDRNQTRTNHANAALNDSQRCVLPRNDLYLNAHPALNNYKGLENEKMSYGRKPESPSCTSLHLYARKDIAYRRSLHQWKDIWSQPRLKISPSHKFTFLVKISVGVPPT